MKNCTQCKLKRVWDAQQFVTETSIVCLESSDMVLWVQTWEAVTNWCCCAQLIVSSERPSHRKWWGCSQQPADPDSVLVPTLHVFSLEVADMSVGQHPVTFWHTENIADIFWALFHKVPNSQMIKMDGCTSSTVLQYLDFNLVPN